AKRARTLRRFIPYSATILREPPCLRAFVAKSRAKRVLPLAKASEASAYSKVHPLFYHYSPCTSVSPRLGGKISSEASTTSGKKRAKRALTLRSFIPYSTTILRAPPCLRALWQKRAKRVHTSSKKRAKRLQKKKE